MPLLIILLALLVPRITILALWLFTSWFHGVFSSGLWAVLGFLFMPLTLLWFSVVQRWFGGDWNILAIIGMIVAVVLDLSPTRFGRRRTVV